MRRNPGIIAGGIALALASAPSAMAVETNQCPNGGTVRFGVEPYDTAARLVPIYQKVGELIGDKLGCKVEVFVATSLVGAGGIGFELLSAMSLFQYQLVSLLLIVTFVMVIAAERLSALLRSRLG